MNNPVFSHRLPGLTMATLNLDRCPLNRNFNPGPQDCQVKLLPIQLQQRYLMKLNMSIRKVWIAQSV